MKLLLYHRQLLIILKNKKYKKKYIKYTEIKRIKILYLHYYTVLLL